VNNLIDNALKYSGRDTAVRVSLSEVNNRIHFSVADNGEGIDEAEKKKIFLKFYRVGDEAVRKAKGTGLGLYLCKRIAKDHKGLIEVKNNEPKGSVFTVILRAI